MSFQNISPAKFKELSESADNIVLDVRSEQEYAEGQIPGHRLINFFDADFKEQLEAKLDKSKNYLVYCRSGNRSGKTCHLMESLGFTGKLYNLEGGIQAWNASEG